MDADNTVDIDRELLSAYLDDALTKADRARVEMLLRVSDSFRRELAEMVRVRQLFAAWSPPAPDQFFVRRVDIKVQKEMARIKNRWGLQKLATAAMLLISIGSLAFLSQRLDRNVEPVTLDTFLQGSLDSEVREVASLTEDDFSKDRVLNLVLSDNTR
jgi:anti-sigma factor RsiW